MQSLNPEMDFALQLFCVLFKWEKKKKKKVAIWQRLQLVSLWIFQVSWRAEKINCLHSSCPGALENYPLETTIMELMVQNTIMEV